MADAKQVVLNQYEAMFLFGSGFAADVDGAQKIARGMIELHGGQLLLIKKWDERKLAYEIEGQKRGVFVIAFFKAPGAAVTQIERDVNLNDQVLRVLITKADHMNTEEMAAVEPQPIQVREERNPWDRPGFNNDEGSRPAETIARATTARAKIAPIVRPAPPGKIPEAAVGKE